VWERPSGGSQLVPQNLESGEATVHLLGIGSISCSDASLQSIETLALPLDDRTAFVV
jgi:hypothetical protein